jgi:spore maturation protein CgeB
MGEIYDEYRIAYNKARVALSWSSLNDLPARVWEGMGMNLPVVTNRVPDLSNFFVEGEHYLGFSNVQEAEKQVLLLLSDDAMRDEMANNAYRKVIAGHTYDHRISQILENAKLI